MKHEYRILIKESRGDRHAAICRVEFDEETKAYESETVPELLQADSQSDLKFHLALIRTAFWKAPLVIYEADGERSLEEDIPEVELDDFHHHEAMDRASIWAEQFQEVVASHPAITSNSDHSKVCEQITDLLSDLYLNLAAKAVRNDD
jgi:hypothetical protein